MENIRFFAGPLKVHSQNFVFQKNRERQRYENFYFLKNQLYDNNSANFCLFIFSVSWDKNTLKYRCTTFVNPSPFYVYTRGTCPKNSLCYRPLWGRISSNILSAVRTGLNVSIQRHPTLQANSLFDIWKRKEMG